MGPAALLSVDPFRPCENSLSPKLYLSKDGNFSRFQRLRLSRSTTTLTPTSFDKSRGSTSTSTAPTDGSS